MMLLALLHRLLTFALVVYVKLCRLVGKSRSREDSVLTKNVDLKHLVVALSVDVLDSVGEDERVVVQFVVSIVQALLEIKLVSCGRLSFYDVHGSLRKLIPKICDRLHVESCEESGFKYKELEVHFVNYANAGKLVIPAIAKKIVQSAKSTLMTKEERYDFIQAEISKERELTLVEPDLMLVFCKVFSLQGFSPIHLKYTQMIHCDEGLSTFSKSSLTECLVTYSNCQQRYGA